MAVLPSWNPPGNWQIVFDDEFTGTSVNTANWHTGFFGNTAGGPFTSNEQATYDPANLSVSGGLLTMSLTNTPSTGQFGPVPYTGACIMTNGIFDYSFGSYEVRANLTRFGTTTEIANWPAIWQNDVNTPANGELDVLEGLGGAAEGHWHAVVDGVNFGTPNVPNMYGFHTFGAQWDSGEIQWFYDGKFVASTSTGITADNEYLVILHTTTNTFGNTVVVPATIQIDWVRVWQESPIFLGTAALTSDQEAATANPLIRSPGTASLSGSATISAQPLSYYSAHASLAGHAPTGSGLTATATIGSPPGSPGAAGIMGNGVLTSTAVTSATAPLASDGTAVILGAPPIVRLVKQAIINGSGSLVAAAIYGLELEPPPRAAHPASWRSGTPARQWS